MKMNEGAMTRMILIVLMALALHPSPPPGSEFDRGAWKAGVFPPFPSPSLGSPRATTTVEPGSFTGSVVPESMTAVDWIMVVAYATESSYGADCKRGDAGERGCYQILPSTAEAYGCVDDDSAHCARRIILDGIKACGLNIKRVIHRYNTGECSDRMTYHVQRAMWWFESLQDQWHAEHRRPV